MPVSRQLRGLIAGSAQTSTGAYHEFVYSNGSVTDLGPSFITTAINDHDVIVGTDQVYSGGTLWPHAKSALSRRYRRFKSGRGY